MQNLFVGTSGFSYSKWKGDFYPEDLPSTKALEFYSQKLNSVEINSSFYNTPRLKTVQNWKETVPKDFVFVFKGSRFITHLKNLDVGQESFDKFFTPLEPFATKNNKHCILWQMAASFHLNYQRLEDFLKQLPRDFRHAFEFRHQSWFTEEVYKLLRTYNAAVVFADSPKQKNGRRWPMVEAETASFFYIRFHGSKKIYTSRYTDEELHDYAKMIKEKLSRGLSVYAYFNNDAAGYAPYDAQRLVKLTEN